MPAATPACPPSFQVYLAEWEGGTLVAVKVLLMGSEAADADGTRQALQLSHPVMGKLEAEAGLLASLRHPNIVVRQGGSRAGAVRCEQWAPLAPRRC